jgi:phage shock protein PspC (stress-responsive transcriptional regulator)
MAMSDFVTEFRSLRRPRDGRVFFGVCRSLADRFGTDVFAIRLGAVLASAVVDYVPLAYIIAVLFIPALPKESAPKTKSSGRFRQIVLFMLLGGFADAVIDDSLPSNKAFAVLLVVGGLMLMNVRNRSLRSQGRPHGVTNDSDGPVGGWATPSDLPPRWGLAGETANPHIWTNSEAPPQVERQRSMWQSQFGNLALVTLVSVLALGLWSNTSNKSPIRKAAMRERISDGPLVVTSKAELDELAVTNLGDGAFVIDMTRFALDDVDRTPGAAPARPKLSVDLGSGRLDLIVSPGTLVDGSVSAFGDDGVVVVRTPDGTKPAGLLRQVVEEGDTEAGWSARLGVQVRLENGLVCIRTPSTDSCE